MKRSSGQSASFGPFTLEPSARVLEKGGVPVALGNRALDILIVLVEHAGEVVSQKVLISRVWRDLVVEPGNLRVHMRALRKALGDGIDGARYIENVTGQGYCFVAPVVRIPAAETPSAARTSPPEATSPPSPSSARAPPFRALPAVLGRMIGRDDTVREIAADLRIDRFVTIVGPGGMGKTTVAVCVAHAMREEFSDWVCFVDLAAIADPKLLAATVASTLGLAIQGTDALVSLMAFLQQTRMLLVLDNCEHVIDAAASLTETIFTLAREVYVLATSREAMRVEGEHAHWLRPLGAPSSEGALSAATALAFPAVRLFVERAVAADHRFELNDANARIVAEICGRLDGVALALELVAGRIGSYGLAGTLELLDKRLGLQWPGRRTAHPRHQTLQALLDWSYGLLQPSEQRLLRRLSIFVGPFTLEAAQSVASDARPDETPVPTVLDQLIAKSLVSVVEASQGTTRYRLLETTRLYLLKKLEGSEANSTAERHVRYVIGLLLPIPGIPDRPPLPQEHLGNVRAALEYSLGGHVQEHEPGDPALGIDLVVACVPLFLGLSLWNECRKWSEAALSHFADSTHADKRELVLQDALAISSLLINANDAHAPIIRGLELAEQLGETAVRFRLLGALHVYVLRRTDFRRGLEVAEEMDAVARASGDASYRVISDWMLGSSHYVLGHPEASMKLFESGFDRGGRDAGKDQQLAGLYYRTRALYGLARVQWLCGLPGRALRTARQAIAEAAESDSPVNVSYSLVYCCYVFLWCGDLNTAEQMIEKVMAQPHWQGRLVWFHAEALALKGELLVRRGKVDEGIQMLRGVLNDMQASPQKNLMQTVTSCSLAEALAQAGRADEALCVIEDAIRHSPGGTETWDGPELLRVRGSVLLSKPQADLEQAEASILQSITCARHQGAKGWELRATMTLARLRVMQGRAAECRSPLARIYSQFTEGHDSLDIQSAAHLLHELDLANREDGAAPPGGATR